MINRMKLWRETKDYLVITLGLMAYAMGWCLFLLPYQISTGGVTGISAIIYYATGVEMQISLLKELKMRYLQNVIWYFAD